jgi:hypothetical protein
MGGGYHYLVSSLPALRIGEPPPVSLGDFLRDHEEMLRGDWGLVEVLLLRNDVENLHALLTEGPAAAMVSPSVYTREELEEAIKLREGLPPFMLEHIARVPAYGPSAAEAGQAPSRVADLVKAYLLWAALQEQPFFRGYFTFELRLRNAAAGIRARGRGRDVLEATAGEDDDLVLFKMRESRSAPDFGLQGEAPWMARLVQAFEKGEPEELERTMDEIRLAEIDSLVALKDFQIDVILAFLLALGIVTRWAAFDAQSGEGFVQALVRDAM